MKKKSYNMQLSQLLHGILKFDSLYDRKITGLTQDSRLVKRGDLFFAYPGTQSDGRKYIEDAIAKGAAAILVEAGSRAKIQMGSAKIPVLKIKNLLQQVGPIAARFYDDPSKHLKVIGVTGTNGKSSCTHYIAQALQQENESCGVIGTLGSGIYGKIQQGGLTTPDAITLQQTLAEFRADHAKYVAMEVSSHSLHQGRVNGMHFDVGVFTNLTRDHLDYHGTVENYANAKRLMFAQPGLKYGVLNIDDSYGQQWLRELKNSLPVFAYSLESAANNEFSSLPFIHPHQASFNNEGITASVHTPWGDGLLRNPALIGRFNLSNMLAVLTVLGIFGIPLDSLMTHLSRLHGVSGRMEALGGKEKPLIVIDYAHTPDALEQALKAIAEHGVRELWCVFGCGGDRDKGKRPLMGKIAEFYADHVIVTDDNPRHEEPKQIIAEILAGFMEPEKAIIEYDRRRAIAHALSCAQPGDVVLIAGKGHETYQIIGDVKEPFNDALEVQKWLTE